MWSRREIENYLVTPESVRAFVSGSLNQEDLIESAERSKRIEVLNREVATLEQALRVTGQPEPWGSEIKVTDHFLDPLFKNYYSALGIPQAVFKRDYHGLADAIPIEQIDQEVLQVLDAIVEVAERARPAGRASE
jgi:hypothetical protein